MLGNKVAYGWVFAGILTDLLEEIGTSYFIEVIYVMVLAKYSVLPFKKHTLCDIGAF
jgi:hypothetical protein